MNDIHKARQTAEKGADQASKIIDDIRDRASDYVSAAKSCVNDSLEDAQDYGRGAWKDAQVWVKKNPALAVGGAVVFGMLLSTLLSNRDND